MLLSPTSTKKTLKNTKNTKTSVWTDEHEQHFNIVKTKITEATENKHFKPHLETRIKCDSSCKGLGCALEQRTQDGWHTLVFGSRFLNYVEDREDRYSINKLELLGEVWSIEHFKYYLYGKRFTVIRDHRALLYIMKENKANKSCNSRLTRWVEQLLHLIFR